MSSPHTASPSRSIRSGRKRLRTPSARILAALALSLLISTTLGLLASPPPTVAQDSGTADLVVDFGDGHVRVARAAVLSGTSGLDLLKQADLRLTLDGAAVCAIEGVGCPASDCFCRCKGPAPDCRFWGYFHGEADGSWTPSEVGAGSYLLTPGALEGWSWARPRPQQSSLAQRSAALGLDWLRGFQEKGGGLAGHVGFTAEAVFGARAAGLPMDALQALAGRSARDFLRDEAGRYAAGNAAQAGKALAGAVAADLDPHNSGGVDLIAAVEARYDPSSGWFGVSVWDQSWAMIGLAAAGEPIPAAAGPALAAARSRAGGWGATVVAETPDSDSTGLALQAMAAAGAKADDPAIAAALTWLAGMRQADGGFAHESAAGPSNLNATALALQGLLALAEDPAGDRWAPGGVGPLQYLSQTQENSGRFRFGQTNEDISDLVASLQAVPAVAGRSLPLGGPRAAIGRGALWMAAHRGADGSFEGFNPGASIDAVLALAASGIDPDSLPGPDGRPGPSVRSYLTSVAADYAGRGPSAAGKLAAGALALGADPRKFGGEDLVARIRSSYDSATGTFGAGGTWDQSWAILGLAAAEAEIPPLAILQTQAAAASGGGWGFQARAAEADPDSTGLALQALAAAGLDMDQPSLWLAVNRLFELQNADGGWGEGASNAGSTAMAIGGLVAMGQAVDGAGWMPAGAGRSARSPREVLLALQAPGGGFSGFSGPEDPGASYAALQGLSARALPIRGNREPQGPPLFLPFLIRSF